MQVWQMFFCEPVQAVRHMQLRVLNYNFTINMTNKFMNFIFCYILFHSVHVIAGLYVQCQGSKAPPYGLFVLWFKEIQLTSKYIGCVLRSEALDYQFYGFLLFGWQSSKVYCRFWYSSKKWNQHWETVTYKMGRRKNQITKR